MNEILAVSNDEQLLKLLHEQLTDLRFSLETMSGNGDMLAQIKHKKPDVLVIDFILGDENAAAVCHQVTADTNMKSIPVIILSDMPGMEQLGAKLGSFSVIKKPMTTAELAEQIVVALKNK
jgi:two-component system alkaline phosphatase synthesis response regulator PhoP